jgi:hypothetical protein
MKRIHNFKNASMPSHKEISKKVAIHEAGHAAAIYFGNKQKELPPIFFQIVINPLHKDFQTAELLHKSYDQYAAKVEGGRLIHVLPTSFEVATKDLSTDQKLAYQCAFDADIINILVGPLAEAKYIALRDGELINPLLVNLQALQYYGGLSDLEIVNHYLDCFEDDSVREKKASELFLSAFNFINKPSNWLAIMALADHVLATNQNVISCEEIIAVLENSIEPAIPYFANSFNHLSVLGAA